MRANFNEVGWLEIAAQLTVEFLLQNILLEFNWELLPQRLSDAKKCQKVALPFFVTTLMIQKTTSVFMQIPESTSFLSTLFL